MLALWQLKGCAKLVFRRKLPFSDVSGAISESVQGLAER